MKKIVSKPVVTEARDEIVEEDDGFASYLGKRLIVQCMNYNYSGKLVGVNGSCLKFDDAGIVFETGPLTAAAFKDFQKTPKPLYVQTAHIEAWWEV